MKAPSEKSTAMIPKEHNAEKYILWVYNAVVYDTARSSFV